MSCGKLLVDRRFQEWLALDTEKNPDMDFSQMLSAQPASGSTETIKLPIGKSERHWLRYWASEEQLFAVSSPAKPGARAAVHRKHGLPPPLCRGPRVGSTVGRSVGQAMAAGKSMASASFQLAITGDHVWLIASVASAPVTPERI